MHRGVPEHLARLRPLRLLADPHRARVRDVLHPHPPRVLPAAEAVQRADGIEQQPDVQPLLPAHGPRVNRDPLHHPAHDLQYRREPARRADLRVPRARGPPLQVFARELDGRDLVALVARARQGHELPRVGPDRMRVDLLLLLRPG